MDDAAAGLLLFRNVPDFLDADRPDHGVAVFVEIEFINELLGQRASGSFCKNRDLRANIDAGLEVFARLSKLIDAFVAGTDADNGIAFDEQFGSGKSRKDIHAALFDLLAKPARELVERDDVVAVILQRRRNDRQRELARLREEENVIFLDRILDRSAFFLPVRHQLIDAARIHYRSGDDVGADLLPFLKDGDRSVFI